MLVLKVFGLYGASARRNGVSTCPGETRTQRIRSAAYDAAVDRVSATNTHFLLKRYKDDGDVFVEADIDQRLAVAP